MLFFSSHAVTGNILRPLLVGPEYLLGNVEPFSSEDMFRPPDGLHQPGQLDSSPLVFRKIAVLESPVAGRGVDASEHLPALFLLHGMITITVSYLLYLSRNGGESTFTERSMV